MVLQRTFQFFEGVLAAHQQHITKTTIGLLMTKIDKELLSCEGQSLVIYNVDRHRIIKSIHL